MRGNNPRLRVKSRSVQTITVQKGGLPHLHSRGPPALINTATGNKPPPPYGWRPREPLLTRRDSRNPGPSRLLRVSHSPRLIIGNKDQRRQPPLPRASKKVLKRPTASKEILKGPAASKTGQYIRAVTDVAAGGTNFPRAKTRAKTAMILRFWVCCALSKNSVFRSI